MSDITIILCYLWNREWVFNIVNVLFHSCVKRFISDEQCDIDEILRRAETTDEAPITAGEELLSAFKVASFAAFEEDKDTQSEQEVDEESRDWVRGFFYYNFVLMIPSDCWK